MHGTVWMIVSSRNTRATSTVLGWADHVAALKVTATRKISLTARILGLIERGPSCPTK